MLLFTLGLLLLGGLLWSGWPPLRGPRGLEADPEDARLTATRTILLEGPITERLTTDTIAKILYLRSDDPSRPITLVVDSPGGHVVSTLAILDVLQEPAQAPVHTRCAGQAGGMAAWLVAAGAPGRRRAGRGCWFALTPLERADGTRVDEEEARRIEQALVERLAAATGRSTTEIRDDMQAGRRFSAREARAYGLVDAIDP